MFIRARCIRHGTPVRMDLTWHGHSRGVKANAVSRRREAAAQGAEGPPLSESYERPSEVLAAHGLDQLRRRILQSLRHILPTYQPVGAVPVDRILQELAAAVLVTGRVHPQHRDLARCVARRTHELVRVVLTDAVQNDTAAGGEMMTRKDGLEQLPPRVVEID